MELTKLKKLIVNKRKLKGYNQNDLAKILKISQPAYSKYESGMTPIPLRALSELNQILELGLDLELGLEQDILDKNANNLERIADALERIAAYLEKKS